MRALGPCARKWAFKIHCGVRPKMEVEYYFDGALVAYINFRLITVSVVSVC